MLLIKKSKKTKTSVPHSVVEESTAEIYLSCGTENHFPHQVLHFLYPTPGFPTSYNGLSKNITSVSSFLFILHLIRETQMPSAKAGSFQFLKIQHTRKGLEEDEVQCLAIL